MTRLAIIFSLLFVTPAWAGEVDGNSFYCRGEDNWNRALRFRNGKVEVDKGHYTYKSPYGTSSSTVWWNVKNSLGMQLVINRKTLKLGRKPYDGSFDKFWQCEFMDFSKGKKLVAEQWEKRLKEYEQEKLRARQGNKF